MEYVQELDLHGWYISFHHEDLSKTNDEACVEMDYRARQIDVTLSTIWNTQPTKDSIRSAARHEALEMLLLPLELVRERTSSPFLRDSIRHEIIVKLSNYIQNKED